MNPFDDPDGRFRVLVNAEEQYSLWPDHLAVPAGWTVVAADRSQQECLDLIDARWTDLRPRSVRDGLPQ